MTTQKIYTLNDVSIRKSSSDTDPAGDNNQFDGEVLSLEGGQHILMKFDLSAIPANAVVSSSKIVLRFPYYESPEAQSIYCKMVTADWDVRTVTFNNQPSVGATIAIPVFPFSDPVDFKDISIEVASAAQQWVTGTPNYGVLIKPLLDSLPAYTWYYPASSRDPNTAAQYKPHIEITYTLATYKPTNLSPVTTINRDLLNRFDWTYTPSQSGDTQKAFQFAYSTDNINFITLSGTTDKFIDVAPYTFQPGILYWKVRVQNQAGVWSDWTTQQTTVTKYNVSTPINLIPFAGQVINREVINKFEWDYTASYSGDTQREFVFEYSYNNTTWTTLAGTTNNFIDILANTFSNGNLYWRVKVKNEHGTWSNYSSIQQIEVTGRPPVPVISTENTVITHRPVITWSSIDQYGYYVEVLDSSDVVLWQTLKVISTDKSISCGIDLANNTTYKIRVKVFNIHALESDWEEKTITTEFPIVETPIIALTKVENEGVIIQASNPVGTITVIRNDVYKKINADWYRIASISVNGKYTDYSLRSGENVQYKIRAVGDNGGYTDSIIREFSLKFTDSYLCGTRTGISVKLKYNPKKSTSPYVEKFAFKFAGRKYALIEYGEHEATLLNLKFFISTEEKELLETLNTNREDLLFKDGRGKLLYCTMDNLNIVDYPNEMDKYEVTFRLSQVDHSEVI